MRHPHVVVHKETISRRVQRLAQLDKCVQAGKGQPAFYLRDMVRADANLFRKGGQRQPRRFPEIFETVAEMVCFHSRFLSRVPIALFSQNFY